MAAKRQNRGADAAWFQMWTMGNDMHSKWRKQPDIQSIAFFDTYCVQSAMPGCCLRNKRNTRQPLSSSSEGCRSQYIKTLRKVWATRTGKGHLPASVTTVQDWNCICYKQMLYCVALNFERTINFRKSEVPIFPREVTVLSIQRYSSIKKKYSPLKTAPWWL